MLNKEAGIMPRLNTAFCPYLPSDNCQRNTSMHSAKKAQVKIGTILTGLSSCSGIINCRVLDDSCVQITSLLNYLHDHVGFNLRNQA